MKFLLTILIAGIAIQCAQAQDTTSLVPKPKIILTHLDTVPVTSKTKDIRAVKIDALLKVDGMLNEPEWELAAVFEDHAIIKINYLKQF